MSGSSTVSGSSLVCAVPLPPVVPSVLTGIDQTTLTSWRSAAQTALNSLMAGQSVVQVQYGEGQGHRSVRYKSADIAGLQAWIGLINQALGVRTRRPVRVRF